MPSPPWPTSVPTRASIRPALGVMGVSKGGGAALNAAIAVRQRWRPGLPHLFDLHVAICPGATAQHRDPATHDRPIFFMLAGRDDYTPAPRAIDYAERACAQPATAGSRVKVYAGAHHGWEVALGPVFDIKDAENWSCCNNYIEDDGSHFVIAAGRSFPEPDYQAWARRHCVTRGARAGGGTPRPGETSVPRPTLVALSGPRTASPALERPRERRCKTATGRRHSRVTGSRDVSRPGRAARLRE